MNTNIFNFINTEYVAMKNAEREHAMNISATLYECKSNKSYLDYNEKWSDFLASDKFDADRTTLSKLTTAWNWWSHKELADSSRDVAERCGSVIKKCDEKELNKVIKAYESGKISKTLGKLAQEQVKSLLGIESKNEEKSDKKKDAVALLVEIDSALANEPKLNEQTIEIWNKIGDFLASLEK